MTTPTTRLLLSRRAQLLDWLRRYDPWHVLSLLIVLVVAFTGVMRALPDAPRSVPLPTSAPLILVATPLSATPIPTVTPPAELRLLRAVVAYAAPGGTVLGAIEPGRGYALLARSGAAWVQLAIEGSGRVWVRRDDLEDVRDIATPVSTEQPSIIAAEQQRAAPDPPAATAAPTTPVGVPPAPAPTVPRTIVYQNPDGSVFATYICQPYGDWRDTDPMYVHPECSQ
ncbi:MAG TPA: hypothetical protein VGJ87_26045 [Roseiflexaceae bacterium]